MSVDFNGGHRFERCYCCYQNANEINGGRIFQAIGHLIEQAGSIHAVCLPCIQGENASRQAARRGRLSMLQACGLCRLRLTNDAPTNRTVEFQRRLFTLRCVEVMTTTGAGDQAVDGNRESMFIGKIINSEDMPLDPEPSGFRQIPADLRELAELFAIADRSSAGQSSVIGRWATRAIQNGGVDEDSNDDFFERVSLSPEPLGFGRTTADLIQINEQLDRMLLNAELTARLEQQTGRNENDENVDSLPDG